MRDRQPLKELPIAVDLRPEEYRLARLIAARRIGTLRPLVPVVILAAGLIAAGLWSVNWFVSSWQTVALPMTLCVLGVALLVIFLVVEPANVRARATAEYKSLTRLMTGAALHLEMDDAVIRSPILTARESYAVMPLCVETPSLFVLVRDRQRLLVLPKRTFPPERAEEITEFLRHTFARRRTMMRSWIF